MASGDSFTSELKHRKQQQTVFIKDEPLSPKRDSKVIPKGFSLAVKTDLVISSVLTVWTCYIRLWKISQPTSVVFDEVHFGGFASKYISKKFFMDVHPPLAKLLITWVAQLAGFDGLFDFKTIGKDYLESKVPYVPIRLFCGLCGVMVVPIAYWTLRGCQLSVAASILVALMLCYENGLVTNNRLILLDSILLVFTAFTLMAWVYFRSSRSFEKKWWIWLGLTGIGLGCTVSCKWVGLLTIATIGLGVLKELWDIWGDCKVSMKTFAHHFMARALCLIIIPCIIYIACFKIHFDTLPESGGGTSFMSPEFQATLNNTKFSDSTQADVVYGSKIDIRHLGTRGGYLHSHEHNYPKGSKQQQVTLYSHIDPNNAWIIHKADTDDVNGTEYVKHGDIIRLTHVKTSKRLHTHNIRPSTNEEKYQNEVSCYGYKGFKGDSNDNWRVEIIDHENENRLISRRTRFRLLSINHNCALFSRKYKLPDWAYNQQEVTCMQKALLPKTIWMIETAHSDLLPVDAKKQSYRTLSFFEKFIELNKVMWSVNQGLSKTHTYGSRPKDWPVLHRGISFWSKNNLKIYLLGNPLVFWLSSLCIMTYVAMKLIIAILSKRNIMRSSYFMNGRWPKYNAAAGLFFVAWAIHYFPFNVMERQLFLHHYMPALYMATLIVGVFFDMLTSTFSSRVRLALVVIISMAVIYVYHIYIPITYGEPWSSQQCLQATWRSSWDFNCKWFDKKDTPVKSASESEKSTAVDASPVIIPEEEEEEIKKVENQNILEEKDEMDTANESVANLEFGLD